LLALWSSNRASADPILTFEGLQNFEQVANYYNGGTGSLGSGPGPAYWITFSSNGLAYIPGQSTGMVTPFPGDPSPPTVLLLSTNPSAGVAGEPISLTMDSTGGFGQALSFYDIYIGETTPASVQIYSGLDRTGTLLAQQALPVNANPNSPAFSGPTTVSFSGTAYSAVFTGGNMQLAIDDIAFQATPEPSTITLLASGFLAAGGFYFVRRRRTASTGRPVC
jgi:hypothetical protein